MVTLMVTAVVTVAEADGSGTYVQVVRGGTVQPPRIGASATDMVDLMRAALASMVADAQAEADQQVGQMRGNAEQVENEQ